MDRLGEMTLEWLASEDELEMSLVDIIVTASALSEDESEVADLVDGFLACEHLHLVAEDACPELVAA